MRATEAILSAHVRNWEMIETAIEDLDEVTLIRQPEPYCNSIAWILWHMSRVLDTFAHTRLNGMVQVWQADGWDTKFNISSDQEDRGVGWSPVQVSEWISPGKETLVGYYMSVKLSFSNIVAGLTHEQLEVSKVILPVENPRLVADALGQVTWDALAHGGQIAYLRGLFKGSGWHR
jgi:hypothetical protein